MQIWSFRIYLFSTSFCPQECNQVLGGYLPQFGTCQARVANWRMRRWCTKTELKRWSNFLTIIWILVSGNGTTGCFQLLFWHVLGIQGGSWSPWRHPRRGTKIMMRWVETILLLNFLSNHGQFWFCTLCFCFLIFAVAKNCLFVWVQTDLANLQKKKDEEKVSSVSFICFLFNYKLNIAFSGQSLWHPCPVQLVSLLGD